MNTTHVTVTHSHIKPRLSGSVQGDLLGPSRPTALLWSSSSLSILPHPTIPNRSCPSEVIPPYPGAVCSPHLVLPKYSATPTGCVCCQRPAWMKCLIWWPLPLRFAAGLGNILGHPSSEVNMSCLLQHPPDGHHRPQVDMTRDVLMKQW